MKKHLISGLSVVLISITFACQPAGQFNESEERAKIIELHNLQRKYHFEKMTEPFVAQMSEDMISVNGGEIATPRRDENLEMFEGYFNTVSFEKWDDIAPPIIRFSDDLSMAYTVVNKEVQVRYSNEQGEQKRQRTEFSWVAIYIRSDLGWKLDCIASTNKPSQMI